MRGHYRSCAAVMLGAVLLLAGCQQAAVPERSVASAGTGASETGRVDLACIFALDARTAWVGGDLRTAVGPIHSVLYHTGDGGRTWQAVGSTVPASTILSVFFLDARHGWAAGAWTLESAGEPFVLRTQDGGATWTRSDLPMPTRGTHLAAPVDVTFVTPSVGIVRTATCIVADEQHVFVTRDGGTTWTFSHGRHDEKGGANVLSVTQGGALWRIADDRVQVSSDDGVRWQATRAQPAEGPSNSE